MIKKYDTVILADGTFPSHPVPLEILNGAKTIVCCDGATHKLVDYGKEPSAIVGDMDSIDPGLKEKFADRIYKFESQDDNDLTKAANWCRRKGVQRVAIIGATGKREDHTIGNISLLLLYSQDMEAEIYTDHGVFTPMLQSGTLESYNGQQVSLFASTPETTITSENLKYPLINRCFDMLWMGTLNESTGNTFSLKFSHGEVIVFREYSA